MNDFRKWRGYLYIALGVGFGVYRGWKSENWSSWDTIDLVIALGMIGIGLLLVVRKN